MPTSEESTDSYLADLLARDAENAKNGVVSGRQKPNTMPKPNMRFLKNIIRETDNHNAALLEKTSLKRTHRDVRDRSPKRQRIERPGRWSAALGDLNSSRERSTRLPDRKEWQSKSHRARDQTRDRSTRHRRHKRKRSRSPPVDDTQERRTHRRRRMRSMSSECETRRSRKEKPPSDGDKSHHTQPHRSYSSHDKVHMPSRDHKRRSRSRSANDHHRRRGKHRHSSADSGSERRREDDEPTSGASKYKITQEDSDSDPLEAMLGPLPVSIAPRGRGTIAAQSGIDARFNDQSHSTQTALDEDVDLENDDWEQALSAARDRAKWRAIGADRLRKAGFTDTEVKSWEKTLDLTTAGRSSDEREKGVDDVVWSKRGEARQWDLGKTVAADGSIQTKASWSTEP